MFRQAIGRGDDWGTTINSLIECLVDVVAANAKYHHERKLFRQVIDGGVSYVLVLNWFHLLVEVFVLKTQKTLVDRIKKMYKHLRNFMTILRIAHIASFLCLSWKIVTSRFYRLMRKTVI